MYESFYGLKEKPFSMLPDPGFLYLSKKHQMALTMLEYGLMNHAGFCVVSGETGSGKTTLLRKLLENIESNITVGMITNTHKGFGEFLTWILSAFNIHEQGMSVVDMHQRFVDFVIEQYAENKTTLLIIDEAQNITAEKLEELRMLSNVNSEQDQVLQVILAGQPELKDTLRLPELKQFAQRISVDYHLGALSENETYGYIEHRLSVAGAETNIFTDEACALIHGYSGGTPRLINLLCDTALVYGFADQREIIDESLVDEMVRERMADSIVPINKDILSRTPVSRKIDKKPESHPQPRKKLREKPVESESKSISSEDNKKTSEESSAPVDNENIPKVDQQSEKIKPEFQERRNIKSPERRAAKPEDEPLSGAIKKADEEHKNNIQPPEGVVSNSSEEKNRHVVAKVPVNEGVKLRGPNEITVVNPESLRKEGFSKWQISITLAAVLAIVVILVLDIGEPDKKVVDSVSVEIPDKIKQQLDEAERFRKELARKQQEDRERMEKLEQQALELKKERDAALAKANAEEKKRASDIAAVRAAKDRERKARIEAEKAKAKAAAIEVEKARLFMEIKQAEIEAREKKLQEQQAIIDKAKQEEIEAADIVKEKIEEDARSVATKKEKKQFRTDPCSGSTARFLSTCR